MHLAVESHVDRSIDGPAQLIQTNIVDTYMLLEKARDYWYEYSKEIFKITKMDCKVNLMSTKELPTPAKRLKNVLKSSIIVTEASTEL